MRGKQILQQPLFTTIDLNAFIPQNHLLRKIAKILDLSFLKKRTENLYCLNNGRPSIDPETFFRMQIIGYLYGIQSDRQLSEECHLNLAYRWFLRISLEDKVPDHSSLTRIRDRLGEDTFKEVFEQIVEQCKHGGLLKGKTIISDASLVAANASFDSLAERTDDDPKKKSLKPHQERYHDFKTGKKERRVSNQSHVSKVDHDSSIVSQHSMHRKLCHKVHYSADSASRVITDCYVTTGARHECQILPERIDYQLKRFNLQTREIIADRGYGRGPTYEYFRKRGIRTYIPLHEPGLGREVTSKSEFNYDARKDRYKCPKGHYLYPYEKTDRGIKRYRITGGHCRNCPLRNKCLPQKQKHRARFIFRNPLQHEIDAVRRRMQTKTFIAKQVERKWKIEGLFPKENQIIA